MRIVCPYCDAAYDVPAPLLAGRRAMRCARCARDWALPSDPPEPRLADPAVEPPDPPAPSDPPAQPAHPVLAANAGVRFGWAGSALLLALGAWSVIAWRQDVMQAWPPSGRLYAALGLTAGR